MLLNFGLILRQLRGDTPLSEEAVPLSKQSPASAQWWQLSLGREPPLPLKPLTLLWSML